MSSADTISAGKAVELTADFAGTTGSTDNAVGAVTCNTPTSVSPTSNAVYTLTVTNAAGTAVTSAVTVTVVAEIEITEGDVPGVRGATGEEIEEETVASGRPRNLSGL